MKLTHRKAHSAITISKTTGDAKKYEFTLSSSKTGADGVGNSWSEFVSNSGRAVLDQRDWFFSTQMKVGDTIAWSVLPMFYDIYYSPRTDDLTIEYTTTLAQGIDNSKHTLELTAIDGKIPPITAIRMYTLRL